MRFLFHSSACDIHFPKAIVKETVLFSLNSLSLLSKIISLYQFSSVSQSCPTLWPHGLQHARPPCPSPIPRAYSNSCPLSRWCHPTISSSVVPFSHLQYFPAAGSFPMSQFFTSGGQSIGVSASASVLPMNIPDWFSLGRTGWTQPVYFTTYVGVFLSILFSWSVFVFMPVSHQFHYCSFIICFEFRKYEALTFVLHFPDHFLLFRALAVPYEC